MATLVKKVQQIIAEQSDCAAVHFIDALSKSEERLSLYENPKAQQKGINNFLRLELAELPIDTCDARSYLLDNLPQEEWLEGIRQVVAPVVATAWYEAKQDNK